ncbi:hypothetical protein UlMin_010025 [Ulmus minor]
MNYSSRRILPPGAASRKRKEREETFYSLKPSNRPALAPARAGVAAVAAAKPSQAGSKETEPGSSNRLLAGYMAYEFLTKGTIFGEKYDPARAKAVPVGGFPTAGESRKTKPEAEPKKEHQSYAEVASILKTDGAHIPGVVNPTQLARWIQM